MASLSSLQGSGGGRIPLPDGRSYTVSRTDLARIIDSMPTEACRAMHIAVRVGDHQTAQHLLREAAATYFADSSTVLPARHDDGRL
jgi:tartrate dehydratase alpha subunit/fumarate hydratase class I-like protein